MDKETKSKNEPEEEAHQHAEQAEQVQEEIQKSTPTIEEDQCMQCSDPGMHEEDIEEIEIEAEEKLIVDLMKEEEIKKMLEEAGIDSYEPEVIKNLSDYIDNYAAEILDHATMFMNHANRKTIDVSDVNLAIDVVQRKNASKRLSRKQLIRATRELNKELLPHSSGKSLLLPNDEHSLTKTNYRLKSNNNNNNHQFAVPMMNITNRQNHIVHFNNPKNHPPGVATVIRTSTGSVMPVTVPLNLAQPRIFLKPTPSPLHRVVCTTPSKAEEKNLIKWAEAKK